MGITQFKSYKMYAFINMVITRVKNRSPDMILTAFDWKFHEKKDELPPEACRPQKHREKNNIEKVPPKKVKKNNADKEGPPSPRPPARPSGGSGGRQPPGGPREPLGSLLIALYPRGWQVRCWS